MDAAHDDEDLARYQAALLDVFTTPPTPPAPAGRGDPEAAITALRERAPEHAAYIKAFEPRMVSLGMHLATKWGRRC